MVGINRKGDVNYYLVGIIITVLTFFIYIGFFSDISGGLVSESDDLYCRAVLASRSNAVVKTGEFFLGEITQKCKKDEIKESVKSEDEAMEVIADSMKRCWYRYGEGEYDFMSSWDKEGNWCFTCARVNIEDKNGLGIYEYSDLIDWMSNNEIVYKNGSKISYYDYVNVKYSPSDVKYEGDVEEDIRSMLDNGEGYMKSLAVLFSEQYISMQDLRSKQIRSDEPIYVVYRYDKPDNDMGDITKQAIIGAGVGAGLSIVSTMGAEFLIDKAMTIGICAASTLTGPLAPFICGTAVVKSVNNVYDGVKDVDKLNDMRKDAQKIWSFLEKSVDFSSVAKKEKLFDRFTGAVEEMEELHQKLSKIDPKAAEKLLELKTILDNKGIKHLSDFDLKKFDVEKDYKELKSMVDSAKELNTKNRDSLEAIKDELDSDMRKEIDELDAVEKEVFELFDNSPEEFKQIIEDDPEKANKVSSYIKGGIVGASTLAGGYAGSNLNFNENQYVDLMTKEQYYRLCGTEPDVLQD